MSGCSVIEGSFGTDIEIGVSRPLSAVLVSTVQAGHNREFGKKISDRSIQIAVGQLSLLQPISKVHQGRAVGGIKRVHWGTVLGDAYTFPVIPK